MKIILNQPWFNEYNITESNNIKSFLYKIFK